MSDRPTLGRDDDVRRFRADAERVARIAQAGPLDAPVAACPGWDLRRLVIHLGTVHRWAMTAALTGRPPANEPDPPPDTDLAPWYRDRAERLADALATLDPDAPTWHPFPVALVGAVWPRRQAQETSVHRWDAEQAATGRPTPIEAAFAADGIDEYAGVMLPRLVERERLSVPAGTIGLHALDTGDAWLLWAEGRGVRHRWLGPDGTPGLERADAVLTGDASPLLLSLWGRSAPGVASRGDDGVASTWWALGGA